MQKGVGRTFLSLLVAASMSLSPLVGPFAAYAEDANSPVEESGERPTDAGQPATEQPANSDAGDDGLSDPTEADAPGSPAGEVAGAAPGQTLEEGTTQPADAPSEDVVEVQDQEDGQGEDIVAVQSDDAAEKEAGDGLQTAADPRGVATLSMRGYVGRAWKEWTTPDLEAEVGVANRRLDAFGLKLGGVDGGVTYKAHVQGIGWQAPATDGDVSGVAGGKKRIEAIEISLSGQAKSAYSIWYRVFVDGAWMGWTRDGAAAGTTGRSKRVEMIQVRLTSRDAAAPGSTDNAYVDAGLTVQAHVQKRGWMTAKKGYNVTVGTTGKALRMEAFKINRPGLDMSGDIVYQAHVQKKGWMSARKNGKLGGTTGKGLRIEALRVHLTGELEQNYDVWYRLHVSKVGWLAWASNGESAGTQGLSMRVEAIQVAMVPKGSGAPAARKQATTAHFMSPATLSLDAYNTDGWTGWVSSGKTAGTTGKAKAVTGIRAMVSSDHADGSISYRSHVAGTGWVDWSSDGAVSGNLSRRIEAFQFELGGELSKFFDVWYRAHVSNAGWLGWAKEGEQAGSTGASKAVEAYQVKILPKGAAAPGSTKNHLVDKSYFNKATKSQTEDDDGTMYHNVPWAGQPNNYYCGPTAGYMILRKVGANRSATGASLSIGNVADVMGTSTLGYTSFNDRSFAHGLNTWLGSYIYTTVSTPSYSEIRSAVIDSFRHGYPVAVDAHEVAGGPHYNGHNNATFSHIMVIDGYNPNTDAVLFADPGAGVLWGGASSKFWYPSLRDFTQTYLAPAPWRDGIGMMCHR